MRRSARRQPLPTSLVRWLTPEQAAEYVRLSPHTLERMRRHGGGPRHYIVGQRRVVYDVSDLDRWIESGVDDSAPATPGGGQIGRGERSRG